MKILIPRKKFTKRGKSGNEEKWALSGCAAAACDANGHNLFPGRMGRSPATPLDIIGNFDS